MRCYHRLGSHAARVASGAGQNLCLNFLSSAAFGFYATNLFTKVAQWVEFRSTLTSLNANWHCQSISFLLSVHVWLDFLDFYFNIFS